MMKENHIRMKSLKVGELKQIEFVGDSRNEIQSMPKPVKAKVGYALKFVQEGKTPTHAKPLKGIKGVMEIITRFDTDTYRTVYIAEIKGVVYVLHAFKKKSKTGIKTAQSDIDLIKQRLDLAHEMSKYDKDK